MRMPILAYFTVMGTTLLLLLNLSGYALPDVGSPIKTSQLAGLPKIQFRPDTEPPLMSSFNFGARVAQESAETQLPDTIYAKTLKAQNMHLTTQRQPTNKSRLAPYERRIATVYSHDVMMAVH
jgi:hypothetical protein